MIEISSLPFLVENIQNFTYSRSKNDIWITIRSALNSNQLVSNLAEALRESSSHVKKVIEDCAFFSLTNDPLYTLVHHLKKSVKSKEVDDAILWYAFRGAIRSKRFIEALLKTIDLEKCPQEKLFHLLSDHGFGDIVAQYIIEKEQKKHQKTPHSKTGSAHNIHLKSGCVNSFSDLFSIAFSPPLDQTLLLSKPHAQAIGYLLDHLRLTGTNDPFAAMYRHDVVAYHDQFMAENEQKISDFVAQNFPNGSLKYLINSGIGANEQFNHLISHLNNTNSNRNLEWIIIHSPRQLKQLPQDATLGNSLFMEFSRSGKTEETVKIHEFTSRKAKRIVFANAGPLRELGSRDGNLILKLPDSVSGRFGRNKTPILLAPMLVAGMDTKAFWRDIEHAISTFDFSSPNCLPLKIAQFIYLFQQKYPINHLYLGCNDDVLSRSADEWIQFWNEGVNKNGNDLMMSRYFGLLRDAHANIEGILGNYRTKMGIFLLQDTFSCDHPLVLKTVDPIQKAHQGLQFGDDECMLAEANYQRFSELMPAIKMTVHGEITLKHAAVLGQLWADVTFCYSKLKRVDPGSNPEVKFVRDRAAKLIAQKAIQLRG